jgi:hypothetical protein
MSQSAKGAVQAPTAHAPARHAGVPLAVRQAMSQAPQLAGLVWTSAQAPAQHAWPAGQARVGEHPGTQALLTQRVPGAHWSSVRQSTQARVIGSQRRIAAPPSTVMVHEASSRQPARQRLAAPQ